MNRAWACCLLLGLTGCGAAPQPAVVEPVETPLGAKSGGATGGGPAAAPADERSKRAADKLAEGKAAAAAGDLSTAADAFRAALQLNPALAEAHYDLGVLAEWQGRYDEARGNYEAALQAQADYAPSVIAVGNLLIRKGDRAGAVRYAEQQLARSPESLELKNAVNCLRLALDGRADEVIRETKLILRKDEKNVLAMINLAAAYHQQGKYELAIAILDNARALEPDNPEILGRKALAHEALGESIKARLALEDAAELPGGATPEVYNNLGLIYHDAGDFAGAEAQFRKALAKWPDMLAAQINLGNALKGQQRYADAVKALEKAMALAPDSPDVHYNLGILYLDGTLPEVEPVARLEQAVRYFQRYKQAAGAVRPDDPTEQYIAEAQKRIEVEQKRLEQVRRAQSQKEPPADGGGEAPPAPEVEAPVAPEAPAPDEGAAPEEEK